MNFMDLAVLDAYDGIKANHGGPFGAVIVDENDNIVATGHNCVIKNNDPTAHGEITAIRNACQKLGKYDLKGCKLYTTAYPCPMCLSAIMWANIDTVCYGATAQDTTNLLGFRDDEMYDFIKGKETDIDLQLLSKDKTNCLKLFTDYKNLNPTIY